MDQIVKIVELATSIVCDFLDNFAFLGTLLIVIQIVSSLEIIYVKTKNKKKKSHLGHATLFFDFSSLDPLLEPLAGSVGGQLPLLKVPVAHIYSI